MWTDKCKNCDIYKNKQCKHCLQQHRCNLKKGKHCFVCEKANECAEGEIDMKLGELDCHCDNCAIIDYCNDYDDTPPCEQPRFENVDEDIFIKLAETSEYGDINELLDDVANRMEEPE